MNNNYPLSKGAYVSRQISDVIANRDLKKMDGSMLTLAALDIARSEEMHFSKSQGKELYIKAIEYASILHSGQTRMARPGSSRTPYIEHPLRNTIRAYRWGVRDSDVLSAAVLHDVVEDQVDKITGYSASTLAQAVQQRNLALGVLAEEFSPEIADIVCSVTNPIEQVPENLSPQERADYKLKCYKDHLVSVLNDPRVFIVKLADYVDNAGSLDETFDSNKKEKFDKIHAKYASVLPVFSEALDYVQSYLGAEVNINVSRELLDVDQTLQSVAKKLS